MGDSFPRLSIVITSPNDLAKLRLKPSGDTRRWGLRFARSLFSQPRYAGLESLERCLEALGRQIEGPSVEVVVALAGDSAAADRVRARFGFVQVVHSSDRTSIPELRALGLEHARGEILAVTEDHCVPDDRWVASLLRAHASPHLAIGGAVENAATDRLIDWAVYFCEYGRYMPPVESGPTTDLPGPNVSYKRAGLELFRDLLAPATWEPFWHQRLLERGATLVSDPTLLVHHRKRFTLSGFLRERYHYARSFAGMRVAGVSRLRSLLFVLAAPLLPPLLVTRIMRQALQKKRHRRELLLSLPLIALFTLAWALGELVGYAAGSGDSARRIG